MCGLVGAVGGGERAETWARRASEALIHRGPDDDGWFRSADGRVVLAHRRLAIIDLSQTGHQPMCTDDGGTVLVYNGEIYNHVELRAELERLGHRFRGHSDTEVVVAAHREWGRSCTERFVGMWALALLDQRRGTLWLSRDPFGIKPLYWTRIPDGIAFASEPAQLTEWTQGGIDHQIAYDYLRWGHVDRTDRTFLADVRRVPAGGSLVCHVVGGDVVGPTSAVLPGRGRCEPPASRAEAVAELRRLLVRSVELHLRSDVPVGTALSGGTDSSSIVMLMREVGGAATDLHTFSFVAPGEPIDESRFSSLVAAAACATAHPVEVAADRWATLPEQVAARQFEPFGSLSIVAQYAVFAAARAAGVPVMLDGQGADELFGGYPSFLVDRLTDELRRGALAPARRLARSVAAHGGAAAVARAAARALPRPVAVRLWSTWMERAVPRWLDVDWFERHGVCTRADPRDLPDSFDRAVEESQTITSLPGLLRYEDRNSMAHSVESRVPFLTLELAGFAASLPREWLVDGTGRRKALLVDAMRGLVPDAVLDRTDKVAFAVPEPAWSRHLPAIPEIPGIDANSLGPTVPVRAWAYAGFACRVAGMVQRPPSTAT